VRVVCTLGVTIATLLPTSALIKRRFAGVRRPDQRDEAAARAAPRALTRMLNHRRDPPSHPRRLSRAAAARLLAAPRLERSTPSHDLLARQHHRDAKHRIVLRARCGRTSR
jgi:hypothetical protein